MAVSGCVCTGASRATHTIGILFTLLLDVALAVNTTLGEERVVFQTDFGDLELAFYPKASWTPRFLRIRAGTADMCFCAIFACGLQDFTALQRFLMCSLETILHFVSQAAPITVPHILQLARLGAYNTNHFFRQESALHCYKKLHLTQVTSVPLSCFKRPSLPFVDAFI